MLLLLVSARKTLNQTQRQMRKGNAAATVGRHQEVDLSYYVSDIFTNSFRINPGLVLMLLLDESGNLERCQQEVQMIYFYLDSKVKIIIYMYLYCRLVFK